MVSKPKDKKTPAQKADEKAMSDLKSAHPKEYDEIRKRHLDKAKEAEAK